MGPQALRYALTALLALLPLQAQALEGLEQLQQMALEDQAIECMIHEYARRYNEVLRGYALGQRPRLTREEEEKAHREALQWVRDVWQYADQKIIRRHLTSPEFLQAIRHVQQQQQRQYPHLTVVP